nr:hypothetical protein [Bacteroides sp.]
MKKCLLCAGVAAMAASASAAPFTQPKLFDDANLQHVSNDGRYGAFEDFGNVVVIDLATGERHEFFEGEGGTYGLGNYGNSFSNTGILVGTITGDDAAYLDLNKWEWVQLLTDVDGVYGAQIVTPDGQLIGGYMANSDIVANRDDNTMYVPTVWNFDGAKFGKPEVLPYPRTDMSGRIPQWVMVNTVSVDGKVLGGQILDALGAVCQPIYWTRNGEGKWEYTVFGDEFINPEKVQFPKWQDSPAAPNPGAYMTNQQIDDYNIAYDKAMNGEGDFPQYKDFMDADKYEAYMEACNAYYDDPAWVAQNEWYEAYEQFLSSGMIMSQNQNYLNDNVYVANIEMDDPDGDPWSWFPQVLNKVAIYDFASKTWSVVDNVKNLSALGLGGDNTVLAYAQDELSNANLAYVIKPGATEAITLSDWVSEINPEYAEWIKENLSMDLVVTDEIYNEETQEYEWVDRVIEDYLVTGQAYTAPSMNVVVGYNYYTDPDTYQSIFSSYALPLDRNASIEGVATVNDAMIEVMAMRGGKVRVNGDAKLLQVIDLQGRVMFEAVNPAAEVETGVDGGLYIVKAVAADGSESVVKAAF